jgi:Aspartyl protease
MIRTLLIASIFSVTAAAPAWADCQLLKIGGIEAVFTPNQLYVSAKVNGNPVLFVVSTGSSTTLFDEAVEKLGVKMTGNARGSSYGLTGESLIDSRAVIETLEIGHWKAESVPLRAVGPVKSREIGGVPVIGAMGEDILSQFDVEISIKDKLFALYQPQGCEKASLAYWTPDYNVADIIRFTLQHPRIIMQAKLDGQTIAVELNSGARFSLMSQDIAASHDVTSDSPGTEPAGMVMGIHGQPAPSWVGTFKSFELDQEKISPAKIDFYAFNRRDFKGNSRIAAQVFDVDMLLGFDFLSAHHMLISHSQQKVYFSYAGGKPFAAPKPQEALIDPNK